MEIRNELSSIIDKLSPILPLANSHMVNFINHNIFKTYVSPSIIEEIESLNISELNKIVLDSFSDRPITSLRDKAPDLTNFLSEAHKLSLKQNKLCLPFDKLCKILESKGLNDCDFHLIQNLMSQKKSHEVEMMSGIISALAKSEGCTHIVDVGGGKGYLSSVLALKHKLKILTIDSSFITSEGAVKQMPKVEKLWKTLNKKVQEGVNITTEDTKSTEASSNLCKVATQFITEDTNIVELLRNYFCEDEVGDIMLVGLHTCGNLSSTSLRIFAENPKHLRCLVNVGCCYNLIEEEFDTPATIKKASVSGFPMSKLLRDSKLVLGRNARMLAAQPPDRRSHEGILQTDILFYRALLEFYLQKKLNFPNGMPQFRVGKLVGKCTNFIEYVHKSIQRLGLDIVLDDKELQELYEEHAVNKKQLHAFFLMRLAVAPAIEATILLDRLLYLHEQGITEAYLTQLFDPVVSPRCFAIIAFHESLDNDLQLNEDS